MSLLSLLFVSNKAGVPPQIADKQHLCISLKSSTQRKGAESERVESFSQNPFPDIVEEGSEHYIYIL